MCRWTCTWHDICTCAPVSVITHRTAKIAPACLPNMHVCQSHIPSFTRLVSMPVHCIGAYSFEMVCQPPARKVRMESNERTTMLPQLSQNSKIGAYQVYWPSVQLQATGTGLADRRKLADGYHALTECLEEMWHATKSADVTHATMDGSSSILIDNTACARLQGVRKRPVAGQVTHNTVTSDPLYIEHGTMKRKLHGLKLAAPGGGESMKIAKSHRQWLVWRPQTIYGQA